MSLIDKYTKDISDVKSNTSLERKRSEVLLRISELDKAIEYQPSPGRKFNNLTTNKPRPKMSGAQRRRLRIQRAVATGDPIPNRNKRKPRSSSTITFGKHTRKSSHINQPINRDLFTKQQNTSPLTNTRNMQDTHRRNRNSRSPLNKSDYTTSKIYDIGFSTAGDSRRRSPDAVRRSRSPIRHSKPIGNTNSLSNVKGRIGERNRSPVRYDINYSSDPRSPGNQYRNRSPVRYDINYSSDPRSPGNQNRNRSSDHRDRRHSPRDQNRNLSSDDRDRRHSPRDQKRNRSSDDRDRRHSPRDQKRNISSVDRDRRHSPRDQKRNLSSVDRDRRHSPRDQKRNLSSVDRDRRHSPRDQKRNLSSNDRDKNQSPRGQNRNLINNNSIRNSGQPERNLFINAASFERNPNTSLFTRSNSPGYGYDVPDLNFSDNKGFSSDYHSRNLESFFYNTSSYVDCSIDYPYENYDRDVHYNIDPPKNYTRESISTNLALDERDSSWRDISHSVPPATYNKSKSNEDVFSNKNDPKSSKNDTSKVKTDLVRLSIVPVDFPKTTLLKSQADDIELALVSHIRHGEAGTGPQFSYLSFMQNTLVAGCINLETKLWLKDTVPKLKIPNVGPLKTISTNELIKSGKLPKVTMFVQNPIAKKPKSTLLSLIKTQNVGLHTEKWRILGVNDKPGGICMALLIDNDSLAALEKLKFKACLGLTQAKFTLVRGK